MLSICNMRRHSKIHLIIMATITLFSGSERVTVNITRNITGDRRGRKAHLPDLRRRIPSVPIPNEGFGSPSKIDVPQETTQTASSSNDASASASNVRRTYYMNNEDFHLITTPTSAKKCAACNNDILWKTTDSIVFRHFERYLYPSEKDGKNKWMNVKVSFNKKHAVFYHTDPNCIYKRFPPHYFDHMPIVFERNMDRKILSNKGFSHPSLV